MARIIEQTFLPENSPISLLTEAASKAILNKGPRLAIHRPSSCTELKIPKEYSSVCEKRPFMCFLMVLIGIYVVAKDLKSLKNIEWLLKRYNERQNRVFKIYFLILGAKWPMLIERH